MIALCGTVRQALELEGTSLAGSGATATSYTHGGITFIGIPELLIACYVEEAGSKVGGNQPTVTDTGGHTWSLVTALDVAGPKSSIAVVMYIFAAHGDSTGNIDITYTHTSTHSGFASLVLGVKSGIDASLSVIQNFVQIATADPAASVNTFTVGIGAPLKPKNQSFVFGFRSVSQSTTITPSGWGTLAEVVGPSTGRSFIALPADQNAGFQNTLTSSWTTPTSLCGGIFCEINSK